jgi:hypothetical protein
LVAAASYSRGHFRCANPSPVSFARKETGAYHAVAGHVLRGFAASLLVKIGVTNAAATCDSDLDDGAAALIKLHLADSQACPGHHLVAFTRLRISRRWFRQPT